MALKMIKVQNSSRPPDFVVQHVSIHRTSKCCWNNFMFFATRLEVKMLFSYIQLKWRGIKGEVRKVLLWKKLIWIYQDSKSFTSIRGFNPCVLGEVESMVAEFVLLDASIGRWCFWKRSLIKRNSYNYWSLWLGGIGDSPNAIFIWRIICRRHILQVDQIEKPWPCSISFVGFALEYDRLKLCSLLMM